MIKSTLTNRWQTTIPAEVRAALRLRPGQKLFYEIQGDSVIMRSGYGSVMDMAGCLKTGQPKAPRRDERVAVQKHVWDPPDQSVAE